MSFLTESQRITNPNHQQEHYDPKHSIKTKDFKNEQPTSCINYLNFDLQSAVIQ
jgi:hypothetical protein